MLSLLKPGLRQTAAIIASLLLFNAYIENPRIANKARKGYVTEVQLAAAEATLAEARRQQQAASVASEKYVALVKHQLLLNAAQHAAKEKELEDYEAAIKLENRSCPLSKSDLERLRK